MGDIEFASAFGVAKIAPICGSVTRAFEFVFLDEGFHQDGFIIVSAMPINRQLSCNLAQQMTG